jgi:hypothetical protein
MTNSRRANRNKMSQTKTTDDSGLSYRDAKIFAKGYLGRKMSDEEFRPVYDEWCTSFYHEEVDDEELKMVFRYKRPFGDFLAYKYLKNTSK